MSLFCLYGVLSGGRVIFYITIEQASFNYNSIKQTCLVSQTEAVNVVLCRRTDQ